MRKLLFAVVMAALTVSAGGGCRLFCGDCPPRSYYQFDAPPPVAVPVGTPTTR